MGGRTLQSRRRYRLAGNQETLQALVGPLGGGGTEALLCIGYRQTPARERYAVGGLGALLGSLYGCLSRS